MVVVVVVVVVAISSRSNVITKSINTLRKKVCFK